MSRMWLVTSHEFKLNVFKKSFLIVLFIIPVIIALFIGLIVLIESTLEKNAPIGYVDHSGILSKPITQPLSGSQKPIQILAFTNEALAKKALEEQQIQAYYVLSPDYLKTGYVELFFLKTPGENATRQFNNFLQTNLLTAYPEKIARRLTLGSEVNVLSLEDGRLFLSGNPDLGSVVPILLSLAFIGLIITGGGYIIQAIFSERQNRTIEILSTSLSPQEIVWGKVFGTVAINLIQLIFWVLVGILAIYLAGYVYDMKWFQNFSPDGLTIGKFMAIALPSYVMVSALMFSIGLLVGTAQDSERAGPLLMLAFILPIYFFAFIGKDPTGTVSVILTILPFTSLLTFGLRSLMIDVPAWQVIASSTVQFLCAFAALWLAMTVFKTDWLSSVVRLRRSEKRGKRNHPANRVGNEAS